MFPEHVVIILALVAASGRKFFERQGKQAKWKTEDEETR